ncbi:hypothetical protein AVEN_53714-1 [Araneus ventricosus]|uniref:Endonuclease/exonuclease/phosphatase domain-containing protein n=1 Tax=Araneus ventricosus TaxID=182803 RepID=A0A4Y2X2C8_ARAVE|nr:hypothetical protein AVEN_53714-1 [Araneus ventricosus]
MVVATFPPLPPINFISIYNPPRNSASFILDLESLIAFNKITFIAGDFNAKSRSWNCRRGCRLGKQLLNFARLTGQKIIAPDTPTRFDRRGASIIDLAVARNLIVDCKATAVDELSSDHLPVKFWLNTTTDPNRNKIFKPHWKNFQHKIVSYPTNNFSPHNTTDIEDEIKRFTSELQTAYEVSGKWIEKQSDNFSLEIRTQTQIRNRLKKIAQRSCDPRDKNLYNRAQSYLRKLHYEANQSRHTETIEGLNPTDGSIWKYVKRYTKSYFKMPPLNTPSTIVYTNAAKAEAIADVLEDQFKTNDLSHPPH